MKTFCIAYISFFDNELKQELVEAESAPKALRKYLETFQGASVPQELTTEADIKTFCTDCDSEISVLELTSLARPDLHGSP